jgi:hypothetical protein
MLRHLERPLPHQDGTCFLDRTPCIRGIGRSRDLHGVQRGTWAHRYRGSRHRDDGEDQQREIELPPGPGLHPRMNRGTFVEMTHPVGLRRQPRAQP